MGIKFERKFLRADELLQRWQCSEADLKYEVIEGNLLPIIFVNEGVEITDRDGRPVFGDKEGYRLKSDDDDVLAPGYANHGYLILAVPVRESIETCSFWLFTQLRSAPGYEDTAWQPVNSIPLEKYWNEMVFGLPSVLGFEAARTQDGNTTEAKEKPLTTRERDTLLKLVIGMAVKGYSYDPAALKSPIPKEIANDLAHLGISIDPDMVRKYLKDAVSTVLPANPRQP